MKKKILSFLLIIIILTININVPVAGADEILVFYKGVRIVFDVNPIVSNGRTLVPMRAIFETFGATVDYNSQTKQITAVKGSLVIILNIGNTYATITKSGSLTEYTLDAAPLAVDGRTVVPLRFIGEALGATVNWDGTTRTVTIFFDESQSQGSDTILTATEIAKLMEPRSVILECYDSEDNLIGSGSGFFINSYGHIATNYHIYEDSYKIIVTTSDGSKYLVNKVVQVDKARDLIIIRISKTNTPYVTLGDSNNIEAGNTVYTYGSPQGIINTISDGIISDVNVIVDDYSYIMVTAPISPGSSGGSLIDERGNVIGITTLSRIDSQNMNLAIPIIELKMLTFQSPLVIKRIDYDNGYYYGYTFNDKRHFQGTYTWNSGEIYEGEWELGERTGYGIFTWPNGDVYEGDFIKNERTGYGRFTWGAGIWYGDVYEGDFLNGYRHGIGSYTWSNGSDYYGDWKMGERTGYGIFTWSNGDEYYGYFLNGYFNGHGTIYYTDGTKKSGNWDMGVYTGS
jgi:S1-C subfamily serine protease